MAPWKYKTLEKLAAENINLLLLVLSYFVGSRITYPNQCQSPDLFILIMNYSVFENNVTTVLMFLQGLNTKLLNANMAFFGVADGCYNKKAPNNTCTTTQKQTNNGFCNSKKHLKYDYLHSLQPLSATTLIITKASKGKKKA